MKEHTDHPTKWQVLTEFFWKKNWFKNWLELCKILLKWNAIELSLPFIESIHNHQNQIRTPKPKDHKCPHPDEIDEAATRNHTTVWNVATWCPAKVKNYIYILF